MGGCWLSGQPRVVASSRHDGGGPSGDTWGGSQFVSGALQSGTIVIFSGVVNYRSCELFLDCEIYI